jgi:predicted Zn-dependent peptidase
MRPLAHVLDNGLTLVAEPIPEVRSASFLLLLPAGANTENEAETGASTVLEGMVYRGAGGLDARALSEALDSLGVQRAGGAELEHTSFGASLLADDLEAALELYRTIICDPTLAATEIATEQDLAQQKLRSLEDHPSAKLSVSLRRRYFHGPWGRTALGTSEGIAALTPNTLRSDQARRYRPGGAILAITGRYDAGTLVGTVERLFGGWSGVGPAAPAPSTAEGTSMSRVEAETEQQQIGIAYRAPAATDPDYYVGRLAREVLSGGMAARLFTEVREKRGLCYSVGASPGQIRGAGYIVAHAGTTAERSQETLDVLVAELLRLRAGVEPGEFQRARTGVLSSLVMQGEASRARVGAIARDQYLLGRVRPLTEVRAEVEKVSVDELNGWLHRQPMPEFTIVTLGPAELRLPVSLTAPLQ